MTKGCIDAQPIRREATTTDRRVVLSLGSGGTDGTPLGKAHRFPPIRNEIVAILARF